MARENTQIKSTTIDRMEKDWNRWLVKNNIGKDLILMPVEDITVKDLKKYFDVLARDGVTKKQTSYSIMPMLMA